jgi:UDP-N-acetylglucosamine--N-acetylmuramyl-(pentapeptide) pyrophosphoryl-undecaprenol N-acetylglucosamine transferase
MKRELRVLVTGGGTGGHTIPAIATIDAIKKIIASKHEDVELKILYVGSEAGVERRLATEAKVDFVSIATGKLRRSSNPLRMVNFANIRDAFRVPVGFIQAISVVKKFKPSTVFSTGGYVSVPAVFAAQLLKIPILMHEQTVQIGLANRWSSKVATRIALSYPESADELSLADRRKSFVTGGVVRECVLEGDADRAREQFGFNFDLSEMPVIYITGGAQGSTIINNAVLDGMGELVVQCCIVHQCGRQRAGSMQDETRLQDHASSLPENLKK